KQAVMTNSPGHGVFGDKISDEKTKVLPIENGCARFNDKIALPICPMIGVIGTSPVSTAIETGSPGAHGGNMDCNQIIEGSTLYLPVNVDGALLAMGDLHAVMGDGEISVCGAEIAGLVTVRISIIKNSKLPLPFLKSNGCAMALSSADTLDNAAKAATLAMQNLICDTLPLDFHDAGMLLSLTGNLRICQVVDPLVTCRMELPLWIWEKYNTTI
ncbi:MAG: acetamidase/formamidase family protein, partial [Oscillospiraceae bacterium]